MSADSVSGKGPRGIAEVVMMQRSAAIDNVVQTILSKAGVMGARELKAWKRPQAELLRLSRTDYAANLRRRLSYGQVKELVARATDVWPTFNHTALGPPSRQFFTRTAGALHLHLKAAPYASLALFGFYVDGSDANLNSPLIYVNSAHHALAMGTTFCHEVGHHFCTEIARPKPAGVRFYFDSGYDDHLSDEGELAADVIVSLAGYPRPAAKTVFPKGIRKNIATKGSWDLALMERVKNHLGSCYGFDFSPALSPDQNLQYLAGMMRYAKLRAALLEEYDL